MVSSAFTVFNSCDVLRPYVAHIDDIFKDFTSYKVRVPVTGAIILDESYERVRADLAIAVSKNPDLLRLSITIGSMLQIFFFYVCTCRDLILKHCIIYIYY